MERLCQSRNLFDDKDGFPIVREGLEAPLYEVKTISDKIDEDIITKFAASHSLDYEKDTRWAQKAEIAFTNLDGDKKIISLKPRLRFMMKIGIRSSRMEARRLERQS